MALLYYMRSLMFVLVLIAYPSAQTQTPPQIRITENVTVSARDAKIVADAIKELRRSRDPLVAQTVANNILRLTDAMAASRRVYEVGPLSDDEQGVVDVRDVMEKYSFPNGPIMLRPRNLDSSPGPRRFDFTPSAFIAMCADMASNPLVQLRVIQENKMIVVARMIVDLSNQEDELISERAVLEGVLAGFKNQDVKGVIIGRVLGIADALAVSADHNAPYDLVTPSEEDEFRTIGHMNLGVFDVVPSPRIGMVNVAYDGKIYSATVNHFVWFFIRFLLADEDSVNPQAIRARRTLLGSHLLDNLSTQLEVRVLQSVLTSLNAVGPAGERDVLLGDFIARGPGLAAVKKAPGVSQQESARGADYRTLVVSPKQMRKLPELKAWLVREIAKRSEHLIHHAAPSGDQFERRGGRGDNWPGPSLRSTRTTPPHTRPGRSAAR